jgi:hypothetical protein
LDLRYLIEAHMLGDAVLAAAVPADSNEFGIGHGLEPEVEDPSIDRRDPYLVPHQSLRVNVRGRHGRQLRTRNAGQ